MQTISRWCDWQGSGLDHCLFTQSSEALLIEGVVIGGHLDGYAAHYRVRTDGSFRTREVRIEVVGGPRLHLTSDGEGHWQDQIRNEPASFLTGCLDVDIAGTPATNTLPIKRLELPQQSSRVITVVYIPLSVHLPDECLPEVMEQCYTCLQVNKRYRYEGRPHGFTADIEVDEHGVVVDYPGVFRRLPAL
jgi:hypothetical protein